MTVCTKGLIVVFRKESAQDFIDIAKRVRKIDPTIALLMVPDGFDPKKLPPIFYTLPTLVIYLVNPPDFEFTKVKKLAVQEMGKIEEYEYFKAHGISCLPIERFHRGMQLDTAIYGDWVVLKPENMTSTGKDINILPTKMIPLLTKEDFPEDHLMHQDSYLVQKLVRTGASPLSYRVSVFLDKVLYSRRSLSNHHYLDPTSSLSDLLSTTAASNCHGNRTVEPCEDKEVNEFALNIAKEYPNNPLFGIDIIRDEITGKLYVLETNLGGNTWHFSSEIGRLAGSTSIDRKKMLLQFNAWDVAAEALVRKTHELAS